MKYTNKSGLPQPYVDAVKKDDYSAGESKYTPSSLIKPPYMATLEKEHGDKIEVDVADRFFSMAGQLAHALLEKADSGKRSRTETRVYNKIHDWVIGMQWDRLWFDGGKGVLQDWKMTTWYKFKKDQYGAYPEVPEWEKQLNIGAYILRHGGWFVQDQKRETFKPIEVKRLEIVGLIRDFHKSQAERNPQEYPAHPVVVREIPLWTDEKVEQYILERAMAHDKAKDLPIEEIPPCTPEEMWEMPAKFAVMKKGLKRAVKLFDTQSAAENFIAGIQKDKEKHLIESRPGKRNRCEGYCDVAEFCPHYKEWKKEQGIT